MTWNGRKLMSYTTDDLAVTYSYDSDGLRTQKIVDGVQHDYYYVDGLLRYERKADAYELFYRYDQNGTLVSIVRNRFSDGANHKLYAVTNTRGDVIELRNGNGTLNTKYTYDAWGKLISVTTATGAQHTENTMGMQNSVRYRGYVYDRETGLYYLQSRYYDPETGRFLNADDVNFIGYSGENLSYNAFAYCENEPVNCWDYFGYTTINNRLEEIVALIISLTMIFSVFETIENNTYYSESYSKGEVHIIDASVEEYVNTTKKNVYVVDYRSEEDPNMRILSSYKIISVSEKREIADILLNYNEINPVTPAWKRTKDSIVDEWRFHNLAYYMNYKRNRTADTDLNNEDEGKSFLDFVGR